MSELLGTSVAQLLAALKERRVRIPSEIGAFIALEVSEALLDGPAAPKPADVKIAADGSISVFAPPGSATSADAAKAVVGLLGSLLVASGTGVPKILVTIIEQGPSSGRWDLPSLRDDLEASLVPLNRAAARRILSRMIREAARAPVRVALSEPPPPADQSLDDQLDALLDGVSSPPAALDDLDEPYHPPSLAPARVPHGPEVDALDGPEDLEGLDDLDELDRELDATLDELAGVSTAPSAPPPSAGRPSAGPPSAPARKSAPEPSWPPRRAPEEVHEAPAPDDATIADESPALLADAQAIVQKKKEADAALAAPTRPALSDEDLLSGLDEKPARGSPLPWILAFFAVVAATAAVLALMRPDLVDAALGRPPPEPEPEGPTEEERERMLAEHRARFGTLSVRVLPDRAQVLMYVGRGPALAQELPQGVALEFVAIADGRAPTRAVLPADAEWSAGEEGPRYELAMQAGEDPMAVEELALGETRLPQDVGAPTGELGDVRVITNPPGAKVYVMVGFAPNVVIENVRTDEAVELLVYHEGHPVHRQTVGVSDWVPAPDGSKTAEVEVTLEGYEPPEE